MLPNEVYLLVRQEYYKDLLQEAAQERLMSTVERPASVRLSLPLGDWLRHRMLPQLVIPLFHLYSK